MYIKRADAIKAISEYFSDDDDSHWNAIATYIIKDIPSAEPKWIPCSERMPEDNGKSYLTYQCGDDIRYGWCQVLRYDDGWNCYNGNKESEIKCVVAWMPLPPWKGADDE